MLVDKIELGTNERILMHVRRHWFILVTQLLTPLTLALIPLLLFGTITNPNLPFTLPDLTTYMPSIVFLYSVWLLLLWMLTFNILTHHYLDILILTNERIMLIHQKSLFYRTVASFRLERMQDMHVDVNGILATFFDYGTVHAETASHSDEEFLAYGIPHPRELKSQILRATDTMINEYRARPRMAGDDV